MDPNIDLNFDQDQDRTDTIGVLPSADLAVTKTVDNSTPDVGFTIVYSIEVENLGPSDALGVQLQDLLPSEVTNTPLPC